MNREDIHNLLINNKRFEDYLNTEIDYLTNLKSKVSDSQISRLDTKTNKAIEMKKYIKDNELNIRDLFKNIN